jgi:hypothetical protein
MSHTLISQILGLSDQLVPDGGTTGQVLSKTSNNNYDLSWITITSSSTGGEPIFLGSPAYNITSTEITQWNAAYSWGNPTSFGFLTYEVDPIFVASSAYAITTTQISHWDTSYGWGNHAFQGYLKTETEPAFTTSASYGITSTNITNWGTAYTNNHVHNNFGLLQTIISSGDGTKALMNNGTYQTVSTSIGGSNTQVQYNNSGVLGGHSTFTYNIGTDTLSATNIICTNYIEVGNATTYLSKDVSNNLVFTDAVVGSKTLASLVGGATNYWSVVTGGINYAGNVGINSPSSIISTLTVSGNISGTNFISDNFQYTSSNNLLIGPNAGSTETGNNKLYIANNNTSYPLIYGDFINTQLIFNADTYINSVKRLCFGDSTIGIHRDTSNNLVFQDQNANGGASVTLSQLTTLTGYALKSDFTSYSSVTSITAANLITWSKASYISTTGVSTNYLGQDGNYHALSTGSMTNPMSTVGDIIIGGTSGTPIRLAIGSTSQYLTISSGNPVWANFPIIGRTESSGYLNIVLGYNALPITTTGNGNVAIGPYALNSNTTGSTNIAIGFNSMNSNTIGNQNISIGANSLGSNIGGLNNIAIGINSLLNNTYGNKNTSVGILSLNNSISDGNIGIGYCSGYNETGGNQFYLGNIQQSSQTNDRKYSLMWGTFAGNAGTISGQQLTINGNINVQGNINLNTGYNYQINGVNIITGGGSMTWPVGGAGIPYYSGSSSWGTSYGISRVSSTTLLATDGNGSTLTGITPTQIGLSAFTNTTSPYNTGLGYATLNGTPGTYNTAIGYNALSQQSSTTNGNTAIGALSVYTNTSGVRNTGIGNKALYSGSTANGNIGIGYYAGSYETVSNQFYLNNIDQTNNTNERSSSLLWGTFSGLSGSITSQQLTVNGTLNITGNVNIATGYNYKINGSNITSSTIGAEPALGNPSTNGYILSSTNVGVRSWIAQSSPATGVTLASGGSTTATLDFSNPYYTVYNDFNITANITIGISTTRVSGSSCVIIMTSDGTHIPTFSGSGSFFLESNSATFSTTGKNLITFVCINGNIYYNIAPFSSTGN